MEEEEYSGISLETTFNAPNDLLIEPLEEDLKCIKVRSLLWRSLILLYFHHIVLQVKNTGKEETSLGGFTLKSTSEGEKLRNENFFVFIYIFSIRTGYNL